MSERYCPQKDIVGWLTDVGVTREELQSQIDKKTEEDLEVLAAWVDGDDEQLAAELTDSVIVSIGMLGLLNVDVYTAIQDKVALTRQKYDPLKVQAYIEEGLTRGEAFARLKGEWTGQEYPPTTHPDISQNTVFGEQSELSQLSLGI